MSNDLTNNLKDYSFLEVINSGSSSTYYKVLQKSTGHIFVWKAIDYGWMSENDRQLLISEVQFITSVPHPNILKIYNHINHEATSTMYIVLEYCDGGDLATLIRKCKTLKSYVAEPFVWKVLYQTSKALQACHIKMTKVTSLHCNVTASNVFLDEHGNVKLGGFELSKPFENNDIRHDISCLRNSFTPGAAHRAEHQIKADVWSLGCLIHELASLHTAFHSKFNSEKRIKIPSHYSEDLRKIVDAMLESDEECRPTPEAILHHPVVVSQVALSSLQHLTLDKGKKPMQDRESIPITGRSCVKQSEKSCQKCKDWEHKLESVRLKEASIKSKETRLKEREYSLMKRERQIVLMERLSKEKLMRTEVYLKQSRNGRRPEEPEADLNESSCSADPGDLSFLPTISKLDPVKLPKPAFLKNSCNRRSVHFEAEQQCAQVTAAWLDNKRSRYFQSQRFRPGNKENFDVGKAGRRGPGSVLSLKSLKASTEDNDGVLETHFR